MKNRIPYIQMYISFFIYSLSSIMLKLAAREKFLSLVYILFILGAIIILGCYAVLWQLVLENMPLSIAMANKPIALLFSLCWTFFLFKEPIAVKSIVGIFFMSSGMFLISTGK